MHDEPSIDEAVLAFRDRVRSTDVAEFSAAALAVRRWMIAHDPHYPTYHLTGPESWINDPNGPIHLDGRYHLFYQYDPIVRGADGEWVRSNRCWGHAVSDDLIRWEDWPVAMWPDTPYDYGGVYSGNVVLDDDGIACALYTGSTTGNALDEYGILARSRDGMLTWEKQLVMDVSQRPNPDTPVHHDGYVWKKGETWYQLIGGTTGGSPESRQGAAWLWTSTDLGNWRLNGNIAPSLRYREFWELPYLIELDGRQVLLVGSGNPCWIGTFDDESLVFAPDHSDPQDLDPGHYYSFNLNMTDEKGPGGSRRQLMHGWVTGPASPSASTPYWEGAHSIPRVLSLKGDRVWQEPIPEIERIRGRHRAPAAAGELGDISGIQSDALEIRLTFAPGTVGTCGMKVRVSPGGADFTRVYFDCATRRFGVDGPTLDRNAAAFAAHEFSRSVSQESRLAPEAPIELRIFVDRSIIEVFVNGTACTARTFPDADALGVEVFAASDDQLLSLDVWEMGSIWD
jgi:sucrose-6-phosphate hydrolase SacC (GH32 family)